MGTRPWKLARPVGAALLGLGIALSSACRIDGDAVFGVVVEGTVLGPDGGPVAGAVGTGEVRSVDLSGKPLDLPGMSQADTTTSAGRFILSYTTIGNCPNPGRKGAIAAARVWAVPPPETGLAEDSASVEGIQLIQCRVSEASVTVTLDEG